MADRIIIVGTRRGGQRVPASEIAQMAGRCGRKPGDIAHVDVMVDPEDADDIAKAFSGGLGLDVQSVMTDPETVTFHLVAEIATGKVLSREDASKWWSRSFAGMTGVKDKTDAAIDIMIKCGAVEECETLGLSDEGHIAHALYFHPLDIAGWRDNFTEVFTRGIENTDAAIAWAASHVREGRARYHPQSWEGASDFLDQVSSLNLDTEGTLGWGVVWFAALGGPRPPGCGASVASLRADLDRHIQVFLKLDLACGWGKTDFLKALGVRAKRGMGSEATGLCSIPGMSRAVAEELLELGVTEISELTERADIIATMGSDTLTAFLRRHGLGA